jgi:peptidoglycan/xylan/chitin deacetylase (PgdA/CDA1 family)
MTRRPIVTTLAWKVRSRLSEEGRHRARRVADAILSSVGSINGAASPSLEVALTFDDGPDATVTPQLLDLLLDRGARGTFFLLTDRAARHPDLVRRMAAEGHEIALHADRHQRLTELPLGELRCRLRRAREFLQAVSNQPVRFFRPPFGAQSLGTYLAARACGLDVVVWGPYAEDWAHASHEAVAERALKRLSGGDVLLLHDGLEVPPGEPIPTFDRVRAFSLILDGMSARGLRATTVSGLTASASARRTAWFRP